MGMSQMSQESQARMKQHNAQQHHHHHHHQQQQHLHAQQQQLKANSKDVNLGKYEMQQNKIKSGKIQ